MEIDSLFPKGFEAKLFPLNFKDGAQNLTIYFVKVDKKTFKFPKIQEHIN